MMLSNQVINPARGGETITPSGVLNVWTPLSQNQVIGFGVVGIREYDRVSYSAVVTIRQVSNPAVSQSFTVDMDITGNTQGE